MTSSLERCTKILYEAAVKKIANNCCGKGKLTKWKFQKMMAKLNKAIE